MKIYLSIIGFFSILLYFVNILADFTSFSNALILLMILGGVLFEFAIDGLFAILIHFIPNSHFDINRKIFTVSQGERKFYEKIKIRKWKDKVWELGGLGGFSKKNLKTGNDKEYLKKFLVESNKGVVNHVFGLLAGFSLIWIFPSQVAFCISLPIAIINLMLNLPSLFILRYNTPKLMACYKRLERTANLKTEETEEAIEKNKA